MKKETKQRGGLRKKVFGILLTAVLVLSLSPQMHTEVQAADQTAYGSEGIVAYHYNTSTHEKTVDFNYNGGNRPQGYTQASNIGYPQVVYCVQKPRSARDDVKWGMHFRWRWNLGANKWLLDNNKRGCSGDGANARGSEAYDDLMRVLYAGYPNNGYGLNPAPTYGETQDAVFWLIDGGPASLHNRINEIAEQKRDTPLPNGNLYMYIPDSDAKQVTQNTVGLALWGQPDPTPTTPAPTDPTDPTDPTNPTDPAPTTPAPADPTDPTDPTNPTDPTDPTPTTAADETTTAADETSTAADETSTAADETSTAVDETSTAADESTTAADESTTAADESTTAADESTSAADESTSAADESTSAADESTSAADESTSAVDETTTAAGETTTADSGSGSGSTSTDPSNGTDPDSGSGTGNASATTKAQATADAAKTSKTTAASTDPNAPAMGDGFTLGGWLSLLLTSAAALVLMRRRKA